MIEKSSIVIFLLVAVQSLVIAGNVNTGVIPAPQQMKMSDQKMILPELPVIVCSSGLEREAAFLREYLNNIGVQSVIALGSGNSGTILLTLDPTFSSRKPTGYQIEITNEQIQIRANSKQAVFYGIQTLRQLLHKQGDQVSVAQCEITDYPAFQWRAFMLDESRAFKGKEIVKILLDEMARLKMNIFHWHLTDDQGWRIEIQKYPKLTEVGAWRDSTQIGGHRGTTYDKTRHGGFYTAQDIREIVAYAQDRHIEVIPEFEMPGHQSAAIAAYPWLGTSGKQINVPCKFGVMYDVMNVADPRVITFIQDVIDELIALFPSPIIHIGGDEVKYDQWKASPAVIKYMTERGLKNPADLQIQFTNMISGLLQQKGKRMMGWNDITGNKIHHYQDEKDTGATQKLADGTIVQFWKGDIELIEQTARKGYDIVNSYHNMTYLDYDYKKIPLEKAYSFNPIPEGLDSDLHSRILGSGCQMWGEEIQDNKKMFDMIFPRIAAYAECGWTNVKRKDFKQFEINLERLKEDWKYQAEFY